MKRIGSILTTSCALILSLALDPDPAQGAEGGEVKNFVQTPDEIKLFELTNLERKKKNLPPLALKPALSMVARQHSANMARQGKLEHKLDGKTIKNRLRDADCKFVMAGENLARVDSMATVHIVMNALMESAVFGRLGLFRGWRAPVIMKGLMESAEHRDNVLEVKFTEVGVGMARNKDGDFYFTQVFIQPRKDE